MFIVFTYKFLNVNWSMNMKSMFEGYVTAFEVLFKEYFLIQSSEYFL